LDGIEAISLLALGISGLIYWFGWYLSLVTVTRWSAVASHRLALALTPILCAFGLLYVLRFHADSVVRTDTFWQAYYMVVGAGWTAAMLRLVPFLSISVRDDVLERRNAAALPAVQAAMVAITLCFAGANIGNGPGVYVVLLAAALSTAVLFLAWIAVDRIGLSFAERITVERSFPTGVRLGGFLIALACILAAAVAGDWSDLMTFLADFLRYAWPIAFLSALAVLVERQSARLGFADSTAASVFIAALYIASAVGYVMQRGVA